MRSKVIDGNLVLELDEEESKYLFHSVGRIGADYICKRIHEYNRTSVKVFWERLWQHVSHGYYKQRGYDEEEL